MGHANLGECVAAARHRFRSKGLPFSGEAVTADLLSAYVLARRELREAKAAGCKAAKFMRLQKQVEKSLARIVAVLSPSELAEYTRGES
jgi:hypothetical protein